MTASLTIYGLANCDTMRKARTWLREHEISVVFHDYRKEGVDPERLRAWVEKFGWEKILNRSGTTFRKLPPERREGLDEQRALALMLEQPAMIRRPVLEGQGVLLVGFRLEDYAVVLSGASAPDRAL